MLRLNSLFKNAAFIFALVFLASCAENSVEKQKFIKTHYNNCELSMNRAVFNLAHHFCSIDAENGDLSAIYKLATLNQYGAGMDEPNHAKAVELYFKVAEEKPHVYGDIILMRYALGAKVSDDDIRRAWDGLWKNATPDNTMVLQTLIQIDLLKPVDGLSLFDDESKQRLQTLVKESAQHGVQGHLLNSNYEPLQDDVNLVRKAIESGRFYSVQADLNRIYKTKQGKELVNEMLAQEIPEIQYFVGEKLLSSGKFEDGINLIQKASKPHLNIAKYRMGEIYENPKYGRQDISTAFRWYDFFTQRFACPAGMFALYNIGNSHPEFQVNEKILASYLRKALITEIWQNSIIELNPASKKIDPKSYSELGYFHPITKESPRDWRLATESYAMLLAFEKAGELDLVGDYQWTGNMLTESQRKKAEKIAAKIDISKIKPAHFSCEINVK